MGDEYTESYYFCDLCQAYTVEIFHDHYLGEGDVLIKGPMTKAEGDAKVDLVGRCPTPWDKKCRCDAHIAYFGGALD
jgi:hypothetical protein